MRFMHFAIIALGLLVSFSAIAEENRFEFGGDHFVVGQSATISAETPGDAFLGGNNVLLTAPIGGDAHAVGNTISIDADVGGNVYAMGNSVLIRGAVDKDVSAAGSSVTILGPGVNGNLRLGGSNVIVGAPVGGSVLAGAEAFELNSVISGDLNYTGESISFGENAKVLGQVLIRSDTELAVPASVAPADRVTFEIVEISGIGHGAGDVARESVWSFWPQFLPGFGALVVVFIVGVLWLALFPQRSGIAYLVSKEKPFKSLFSGILALGMYFGLLVVLAMTLIGIPLVPIALMLLLVAWLMGYIGGAYFLSARVVEAFGQKSDKLGFRVLVLALGLAIAWVLGLLPFLGWLTQLVLVFLGLGAISLATLYRRMDVPYHRELAQQQLAD